MGDFWRTTNRVLHSVAFGLHAVAHAIGRPHFHRPHFHHHFTPPFLDYRCGLRNWFHAQYHIPRRPRPLPPLYLAMHDRMVGRIMAHEHELMMAHRDRGRYTATPPFRHQGSERA